MPYRKEKNYLPHELLQMYRRRSGFTQTELAGLIGLQSRRMIPAWEAGESLPKPDRLKKLIELYLHKNIFIHEQELEEARQLWNAVKAMFDAQGERLSAYPIFDDAWFAEIFANYSQQIPNSSAPVATTAPQPALALVPEDYEKTLEPPPPTPNNLPLNSGVLIGRERELQEIKNLLSQPTIRLVTLTGPGGTGKTRLALQLATDSLADFEDGVFLVRLEALRDYSALLSAIMQALNIKETGLDSSHTSLDDTLLTSLKEALRDKHLLLLLDNFEQLVSARSIVTELLAATRYLKVLVTSREVLHLYGEQEYPVSPLRVPTPVVKGSSKQWPSLAELQQYPAVQLFLERLRLVQPDFKLTEENGLVIAEICSRLDGLPLALELAAGRLKFFSPKVMLERLNEAMLKMLSGGARDLPDRQQTLRNTLEWSYNLLEPAEQLLFRWLAVFVGGSSLEAIEAVCSSVSADADVFELVTSLVDKSLLRQVSAVELDPSSKLVETRFKMLETVRDYALIQLSQSNELETARQQYALYYLHFFEQAEQYLQKSEQAEWLARLELEHANLLTILDWLLTVKGQPNAERIELGLRLAKTLWLFWSIRGYNAEGRNWLTAAIEQARSVNLANTIDFAKALNGLGHMARALGDYTTAQASYTESLDLFRKLNNLPGLAASLNNLGIIGILTSDYVSARRYFGESLELRRELGDKDGIPRCLNNLGVTATQLGDYQAARDYFRESLDLSYEIGNKNLSATCLLNLGEVSMNLREFAEAKSYTEQGLQIDHELGDKNGLANCYNNLAEICVMQQKYDEAEIYYKEAQTLHEELDDKYSLAAMWESRSSLFIQRGDLAEAHRLLQTGLNVSSKVKDKRNLALYLEGFAVLAYLQNQYTRSAKLFGAVNTLKTVIGINSKTTIRWIYQDYFSCLKSVMPASDFEAAWTAGEALPYEEAIKYALNDESA